MSMIETRQISAVILAGGRSSRMRGYDKGLIRLNGKALINHIIDKVQPLVAEVIINANRHHAQYQACSHKQVIRDDLADYQGPLAGFAKAIEVVNTDYVLILPCDSPMIDPQCLISRLATELIKQNAEISVAHDGTRLQPTFALLTTQLLASLRQFLAQGGRKIDQWYQQHQVATVDFADKSDFFINLNTPKDYAKATLATRLQQTPMLGFAALSGTGKTTLITHIISRLSSDGLRIALIKHAHHNFEIDHPGKDSYECYHAGASQVLISSSKRFALINRYPTPDDQFDLIALTKQLDVAHLDLILVEGFKDQAINKIELHRAELNKPFLFDSDAHIIAVATNQHAIACDRVVLDLDDHTEILDFIKAYLE